MLLKLYSSILIPVLSDWLPMEDVGCLDVSVCSKSLREGFLSSLAKISVTPPDRKCLHKSVLDWIEARGMSLRGWDQKFDRVLEKKLVSRCSSLDWLVASSSRLEQVVNLCSRVSILKFDSDVDETELMSVLPKLDFVRELYFKREQSLSEECLTCIVQSCPHLRVFRCSFDASIVINGCKELTTVQTTLTLSTLEFLIAASNLTSIVIVSGKLEDIISLVQSKPGLLKFSCPGKGLDDDDLTIIAKSCPLIESLDIGTAHSINDDGLAALAAYCKKLKHLCMCSNVISDEGVYNLVRGCTNLTSLKMVLCNSLTDLAALYILRYCRHLKHFSVTSYEMTDVGFMRAFSLCPSLQTMQLDFDQDFTDDFSSKSVVGNMIDVQHLRVVDGEFTLRRTLRDSQSIILNADNVKISGSDWMFIFGFMPSLMKFTVENDSHINDDAVTMMVNSCPMLSQVTIVNCKQVTCGSLIALLSLGNELTRLVMTKAAGLTNNVTGLRQTSSKLMYLHLHQCDVADWFLERVTDSCPLLMSVELSGCKAVSSEAICHLVKACRLLFRIDVSHCPLINTSVLEAVRDCAENMSSTVKSITVKECPNITKSDVLLYGVALYKLGIELVV